MRSSFWVCLGLAGCGAGLASPRPAPVMTLPDPTLTSPTPALPICPAEPDDPASLSELDPSIGSQGCVLAGTSPSIESHVALVSGPVDGVPLGTITEATATALWDFQDGSGFARVAASRGARVRAFAHTHAFRLHVHDKVSIHPSSVDAMAGTPLHIERFDKGDFHVKIVTPFDEPKLLDAVAKCANLALGKPFPGAALDGEGAPEIPASSSNVLVELKDDRATLYDAPKGKKLFSYRFTREPNYPTQIERRGGFVRLVAWYDQIHIDAWVSRSDVTYPIRIGGGHWVNMPKVRTRQLKGKPGVTVAATPILVDTALGPLPVGELPEGTAVSLGARKGDTREVHFSWLSPPAGSAFRVKAAAVGECRTPPDKPPPQPIEEVLPEAAPAEEPP